MTKTLFGWLVVLLFVPFLSEAQTFILPSGMKYTVGILKWFTLPSGIRLLSEVQAEELTEREQIEIWIKDVAGRYELNAGALRRLADCESKLNPRAYNPNDTDGRPKYGLFQYDKNTFIGKDIWDWKAQTEQTAQWIVRGYWKKWPWCIENKAPELK